MICRALTLVRGALQVLFKNVQFLFVIVCLFVLYHLKRHFSVSHKLLDGLAVLLPPEESELNGSSVCIDLTCLPTLDSLSGPSRTPV